MRTADFNYKLPAELIAQKPFFPRDQCRLMIVERSSGKMSHGRFFNLLDYLKAGDVLVLNDSKVFKARLYGFIDTPPLKVRGEWDGLCKNNHNSPSPSYLKRGDKNKIEIFLLKAIKDNIWEALAKPGKKLKVGTRVWFVEKPLTLSLSPRGRGKVRGVVWADVVGQAEGKYHLKFNFKGRDFWKFLEKYGHVPVPPYVKAEPKKLADYQTVYANQPGSVAAPTAGFHFTKNFLNKLRKNGIEIHYLTLHVGYGTFKPIKCERVEEHTMEPEWVEISKKTAKAINLAKSEGRRVVAVGTTTVRALEGVYLSCHRERPQGAWQSRISTGLLLPLRRDRNDGFSGEINIFITPGFKFKIIDALVTNFHLPQSTLLLLVSAFAKHNLIKKAYQEAIRKQYRFYSFGDTMLIL